MPTPPTGLGAQLHVAAMADAAAAVLRLPTQPRTQRWRGRVGGGRLHAAPLTVEKAAAHDVAHILQQLRQQSPRSAEMLDTCVSVYIVKTTLVQRKMRLQRVVLYLS